jgi:hypothetical protein
MEPADLSASFKNADAVFAGVDLQAYYYSDTPILHTAFENARRLANALRPSAPIVWIADGCVRYGEELHHVERQASDHVRFKTYYYKHLMDREIGKNLKTVIVSGVFRTACVNDFIHTSVLGNGLRVVVAVDAIDAPAGMARCDLKAEALRYYGPNILPLYTDEIIAARNAAFAPG